MTTVYNRLRNVAGSVRLLLDAHEAIERGIAEEKKDVFSMPRELVAIRRCMKKMEALATRAEEERVEMLEKAGATCSEERCSEYGKPLVYQKATDSFVCRSIVEKKVS